MNTHPAEGIPVPVLRCENKEVWMCMSFIDDMKIGKKLIGGFVIVLIIMASHCSVWIYECTGCSRPIQGYVR